MSECAGRGWHYDDLSCCHAAILYEDVEAIRAAIADAVALLDRVERGAYWRGTEVSHAAGELRAAADLLPDKPPPIEHVSTPVHGGLVIVCSCGWESTGKGRKVDQVIEYQVHIGVRSPEALNQ